MVVENAKKNATILRARSERLLVAATVEVPEENIFYLLMMSVGVNIQIMRV
jgi:hypothetical protein